MPKSENHNRWENVKNLCYLLAKKYYNLHTELCARCGVTLEDLRQESYFAFLKAVEAYETDGQYELSTYLNYPLQNAFNTLCGMRTEKGRQEPLNLCDSLDRQIISDDVEITLGDTIESDERPIEGAEERIYTEQLHNALDKAMERCCSADERVLLEEVYYKDTPIGDNQRRQTHNKAIRHLRYAKELTAYRQDIISHSYYMGGLKTFENTFTSSTEWAVLKLCEKTLKKAHKQ